MEQLIYDTFIGIDPGASGGIVIESKGSVKAYKLPGDAETLHLFLYENIISPETTICFIESVSMWRGGGDLGGKQFGIAKMASGFDRLKDALTLNKIAFVSVASRSWQKGLNLSKGKETKEEYSERKRRFKFAAQTWYPEIDVTLHTCDALLIYRYLKTKMAFDQRWISQKLYELSQPKVKKKKKKNPQLF